LKLRRFFLLIAVISAFALTGCPTPKIVRKACTDCHSKELDRFKEEGKLHKPVAEKNCEGCHLPHGLLGALRLEADDGDLCYRCHEKDRERLEKAHVHTPLKSGVCLRCHDSHSSKLNALATAPGNELCFQCHGKDLFEKKTTHKVVTDGCNNCHDPHSSEHAYNLLDEGNNQCVKCHDAGAESFVKAHHDYDVKGSDCLSCHTPHASSGDNLVRTHSHKPFSERRCTDCHNPPDSQAPLETTPEAQMLCYKCHSDLEGKYRKAHIHSPVSFTRFKGSVHSLS
jgi:predicted CXXCH cytochrome family protein